MCCVVGLFLSSLGAVLVAMKLTQTFLQPSSLVDAFSLYHSGWGLVLVELNHLSSPVYSDSRG